MSINRTSYNILIQNLCSKMAYGIYTSIWPPRWETNQSRRSALIQRSKFYNLPLDDQELIMLNALRELVNYCRREVPYYKELLKGLSPNFPTSFEDYRQIPPLDKNTIRELGFSLLSREYPQKSLLKYSTGGSTGEPISVYISRMDHGISEAVNDIFMRKIGGNAGNRIGTLYGGSLDVDEKPSMNRRIKNWFWNYSEHGCFRLDEKYLLEVHAELQKFRPDVLIGYASAIYLLTSTLKSKNIQPNYPRHSIITAAEKLDDKHREVIEEIFLVPVVERYGSRDAGLMAYQLPEDKRFWIDHWANLLEPEGEPDRFGQAAVLVTRLHLRGMPLLRYRIGDLARFPTGWSAQHPVKWLEEINGRILDLIHLPGGRIIHGSEFPHLFKDYDVRLFQVRQEKDGNVAVSIVPGKNLNSNQREKCEQLIRNNLTGIDVSFHYKNELERTQQNKLRPVLSHYRGEN